MSVAKMENRAEKLNSFSGLKLIALMMIFWWHSDFQKPILDLGARAYEFFFVCSGFLVAYNYQEKRMPPTWKCSVSYLCSKIAKMWPLHVITLLCGFALEVHFNGFSGTIIWRAIINFFCLQSWSSNLDTAMAFNGVSWFLSSLFFCYLMAPFFAKIAKKTRNIPICLLVVGLVRLWIEYLYLYYPNELFNIQIHVNPIVRCLEFMMGILIGFLLNESGGTQRKNKNFLADSVWEIATIVVLLVLFFVFGNKIYRGTYALLFVGMIFVFGNCNGILSKFLSNKIIMWLAQYQFEIYLIHLVVLRYLRIIFAKAQIGIHGGIFSCISFVVTVIISIIYKKYFEKRASYMVKKGINYVGNKYFDTCIFSTLSSK